MNSHQHGALRAPDRQRPPEPLKSYRNSMCFGGLLHPKVQNSQRLRFFLILKWFHGIVGKSCNSAYFWWFPCIWGWRRPPEPLKSYRNSIGFGVGGGGGIIFMRIPQIMWYFMKLHEVSLKSRIFMKFHEIPHNSVNSTILRQKGAPGGARGEGAHRGTGRHGFTYRHSPWGILLQGSSYRHSPIGILL